MIWIPLKDTEKNSSAEVGHQKRVSIESYLRTLAQTVKKFSYITASY
jgi:hypothetical protein